MRGSTASDVVRYLKEKKGALIMIGSEAKRLNVNGKGLLEYTCSLADKLHARIAATGSTAKDLRKTSEAEVSAIGAAELVNKLRNDREADSGEELPGCLVLLGYNSRVGRSLVSGLEGFETVFLGSSHVEEATLSLPVSSLSVWQQSLTEILEQL